MPITSDARVAVRNIPFSLNYSGVFPDSQASTSNVNMFSATKLTVAAWVRMEASTENYTTIALLGDEFNTQTSFLVAQQISVGDGQTQLGFGISDIVNGRSSIVETSDLLTDRWYRILCTWDSTLASNQTLIYINGILNIGHGYITNDQCLDPMPTDQIFIGGTGISSGSFRGKIILSYIVANKAFTAQEAADDYFGNVRASGGTLVANWPTTAGSGTTIADNSGNGNTITLTSSAEVTWSTNTPFQSRNQLATTENLIKQSETMTTSPWTTSHVSIVSAAVTPPTGITNVFELIEDATTNKHIVTQTYSFQLLAGISYTISAYFKQNTRRYGGPIMDMGTGDNYVLADLQLGTIVTTSPLAPFTNSITGSIQSIGNGWYRVGMTIVLTQDRFVGFQNASATLSPDGIAVTYAGNGTSSIYVTGYEVSATNYMTPYALTTSSIITANIRPQSFT